MVLDKVLRTIDSVIRHLLPKNISNQQKTFIISHIAESYTNGIIDGVNELLPTVARDKGPLRRAVADMYFEQARNIDVRGDEIVIGFKEDRVISDVDYAKYHIDTGGSYKNPTTPGTKPISTREFNTAINKHIRRNLKNA
ncbi:MAG: hypothetical protein V3V41_07865 [Candidatus Heimdallarchaeota archaeon]